MNSRFIEKYNKPLYEKAMKFVLDRVEQSVDIFTTRYPHVSVNHCYPGEENTLWTSSFYPGMCFLAYDYTKDEKYIKNMQSFLDSFEDRIVNRKHISHDLGFLYTLSCVAPYKLLGNERAYKIAHEAADMLCERYNEKGKYIQAWGDMGIKYPDVKIIIDTMLNLPLLYWTGEKEKVEIAYNHAMTASHTLMRKDGSSYHTYLMNPEDGEAVCGKTHQGHEDESTWARGQGWAVLGYALSYGYTKEDKFLETARKAAKVFIENLPEDFVSYWDFDFTDENPDIRDTSAVAIFVCGLLELCKYVNEEEATEYKQVAYTIMKSLIEKYMTDDIPDANGVLKEGMYHRHDGFNECVIWGDYFFMEALVRLLTEWKPFW